jgi:hypothetical protein
MVPHAHRTASDPAVARALARVLQGQSVVLQPRSEPS